MLPLPQCVRMQTRIVLSIVDTHTAEGPEGSETGLTSAADGEGQAEIPSTCQHACVPLLIMPVIQDVHERKPLQVSYLVQAALFCFGKVVPSSILVFPLFFSPFGPLLPQSRFQSR